MSEEPKGDGPSLEELLDNTPEAVAMRRTRAARAEAARAGAETPKPGSMRRRLVVGGVLALVTAARVMVKLGRSSRTP
jgi:hypothetical protein